MARRRYQKGHVYLRGKRDKVWVGRWKEDELQPDGTIHRRHKSEVLGSKAELPTKRLAQRELDRRLSVVNSPTYRARPSATFEQLAEKWKRLVMPTHAASTQRSEKSDIKAWVAAIGNIPVRDIDCELLQQVISGWTCSPKTIKNRVATFRLIWDSAKAWKHTADTVYEGLKLKEWVKPEQPCFTLDQVAQIMRLSKEPYRTIWRLVAETGIRRGEVCGLNVGDVQGNMLIVQRAVTKGRQLKTPKSGKKRVFSLSPSMIEQLRPFVVGRQPNEPLFITPVRTTKKTGKKIGGCRLEPDNFVKRHLKPILEKLGWQGGAHAFRHGNATLLDSLRAPMAVRQERLGHVDGKTTMSYTHMVSADDVKVASELGSMLDEKLQTGFLSQTVPNSNGSEIRGSQAVAI